MFLQKKPSGVKEKPLGVLSESLESDMAGRPLMQRAFEIVSALPFNNQQALICSIVHLTDIFYGTGKKTINHLTSAGLLLRKGGVEGGRDEEFYSDNRGDTIMAVAFISGF